MKATKQRENGFTLIELMVVIVIAAALMAVAMPSISNWRQRAEFKEASRAAVAVMREARTRAISEHWEYRVDFDVDGGRYQILRGNQANGSTSWTTTVIPWTPFGNEISLRSLENCTSSSDTSLKFSPDGTCGCFGAGCWDTNRFLCIMDGTSKVFRASVTSSTTGHTAIERWDGGSWKR